MFAASEEIILVLLGNKWTESIPILAILTFSAPLKLLTHFAGILCDATAQLNKKLLHQIIYLFLLLILFYLFKGYGLIAFPIIILIGEVIRNAAFVIITKNILKVSVFDILKNYLPGILIGIIVFTGITCSTFILNHFDVVLAIKFAVQIFIGFYFTINIRNCCSDRTT